MYAVLFHMLHKTSAASCALSASGGLILGHHRYFWDGLLVKRAYHQQNKPFQWLYMLKNTFLHIPGIGIKTEKRLWKSENYSWDLFLNNRKTGIPPKKLNTISECLKESKNQMASLNPNYFAELIPAGHHWRFFPEFRNTSVYLDIETVERVRFEQTYFGFAWIRILRFVDSDDPSWPTSDKKQLLNKLT